MTNASASNFAIIRNAYLKRLGHEQGCSDVPGFDCCLLLLLDLQEYFPGSAAANGSDSSDGNFGIHLLHSDGGTMNKKDLLIEIGTMIVVLAFAIYVGYYVVYENYVSWNVWCNNKFGKNNWTAIQVFGHEECGTPWYSLINDCFKCEAK